MIPTVQVLGVPLARLTVREAVDEALHGGLVLAPNGPGFCQLERDAAYRDALLGADLNLTDSGLVILLHAVSARELLPRTSGLGYLDELLKREEVKAPRATFWVLPSRSAMDHNLAWLRSRGHSVSDADCYIAPWYPREGPVEDEALLTLLAERRPAHVVVCIGGGTQEKLGFYLKRHLPYRPGIHCIGAAIAFLTGEQTTIPPWADRFLLGWLFRCVTDPKTSLPRYLRAFRLVYLLARYGPAAPPIAPQLP